jgi:phage gpG-like protein
VAGGAIRIEGLAALTAAMASTVRQVDAATRIATAESAHALEREIKKTLTTSSHRKGTPTPASPGDPPSLVTGTLRRSITIKGPTRVGSGRWMAEVGPTAVYGRIQELGGVTGRGGTSTLPARPYVKPAYERAIASGLLARSYKQAWFAALARSR